MFLFGLLLALGGCAVGPSDGSSDEVKKQYYESGQLSAAVPFKDGKSHGLGKTYYPNGTLRSEIMYVNGEKSGLCKNYYKTGGLSAEMTYENGQKNGPMRKYYESGALYFETSYKEGKQHGTRKVYSRSGTLKSEMEYNMGDALPGAKRFKPEGGVRDLPKLKFKLEDNSLSTGYVVLRLSLDEKMYKVTYRRAKLDAQGNLVDDDGPLWSDGIENEAVIRYTRPPRSTIIDRVDIVATATDKDMQVYTISGTYNLVVD